jgi:hypothetical protein
MKECSNDAGWCDEDGDDDNGDDAGDDTGK